MALTNDTVLLRLKETFGSDIKNEHEPWGMLTFHTTKEKIIDVVKFLRDDEVMQFTFLTDLCAVHWPDDAEKFEMVYHLHSFVNNVRVRIKVRLKDDPLHIPTLTTLFPAANWMERETYDFYGVLFDGHPNLKRILNVDEMTIFPMRKEYPLEDNTRHDKDDKMFGR